MNQISCVKEWISDACGRPLELLIGLSIFIAAAGGGAIRHAASATTVVLLLVSMAHVRSWPAWWRQRGSAEQFILLAFALYFLSAVLSYINVTDIDEYIKHLDRYFRFILIIPIYLLLSKSDLRIFPYLLAGAIVSGPVYLGAALISLSRHPGMNASGAYHHITFGDMAMLGALFLITVLVMKKTSGELKAAIAVSIICLLYSSILSQARGAWLALPAGLMLLIPVAIQSGKMKLKTLLIILLLFAVAIVVSPAKDIISSRLNKAVQEIELYQSGENQYSSVGSRFAMWHVAYNVWKEHPVLGTGPGDYDLEFEASQARGLYTRNLVNSSTHNIYFQALATTGSIGFVILLTALFFAPFRLFYRINRTSLNMVAVSGMMALTAFAVFGLTESWTLRSPAVSMYLIYFAVLATIAVREPRVGDVRSDENYEQV